MNFNPGGIETRTTKTIHLPGGPPGSETLVLTGVTNTFEAKDPVTGERIEVNEPEQAVVHWIDVQFASDDPKHTKVISFFGYPLHPYQKDANGYPRKVQPIRELQFHEGRAELVSKALKYLEMT